MTVRATGLRLLTTRALRMPRRCTADAAALRDAASRFGAALTDALARPVGVECLGVERATAWPPVDVEPVNVEGQVRIGVSSGAVGRLAEAVFDAPVSGSLCESVGRAVLSRVASAANLPPVRDGADEAFLVARYEATWSGRRDTDAVTVGFILGVRTDPGSTLAAAPIMDGVALEILGVVAETESSIEWLRSLAPGKTLTLPGASLDAISLQVSGGTEVGHGEMGAVSGRRTVRVRDAA